LSLQAHEKKGQTGSGLMCGTHSTKHPAWLEVSELQPAWSRATLPPTQDLRLLIRIA